jgi:hypothetical protein
MEYDKSDHFLRAAFAYVQRYDPATYAKMENSNWHVATDVRAAFPETWREQLSGFESAMSLSNSFGTTLNSETARMDGINIVTSETFVNLDAVRGWAEGNDVNPAEFGATVLVHEFQHIANHSRGQMDTRGEVDASLAGSAFAAKLPGRDGQAIKALSDSHARAIAAGETL